MGHLVIVFVLLGTLSGCAGLTVDRDSCANELSHAWSELDIAKADGFAGTVSYTKALGLITGARTMQTVEKFTRCYHQAKKARYYIQESRRGN